MDAAIAILVKAMFAALLVGLALVVASEFYEGAIGRWSIALAAPYALAVPLYVLKLVARVFRL